jgi:hypothetical protein
MDLHRTGAFLLALVPDLLQQPVPVGLHGAGVPPQLLGVHPRVGGVDGGGVKPVAVQGFHAVGHEVGQDRLAAVLELAADQP